MPRNANRSCQTPCSSSILILILLSHLCYCANFCSVVFQFPHWPTTVIVETHQSKKIQKKAKPNTYPNTYPNTKPKHETQTPKH